MKKQKLLFVCNNLHIGGIQRSLLNLLDEIADKYDITLFLFYPCGEYELPKNVRIIGGNRYTRIMGMSQSEAAEEGIRCRLWRSLWVVITRIFGCKIPFAALCGFQKLSGKYDAAISFMQNSAFRFFYGGCNEFVIKSVKAKKKISFVHCDFEHYFGNNAYNRKFYKNFDLTACVSNSCKAAFERVCPDLKEKTCVVHNCFNYEQMQHFAEEFSPFCNKGKINIFTSARISAEKGIFRMIPIFEKLKGKGFEFVWRIAGGGADLEKAVSECEKRGLKENILFLGMQKNPYPYFKDCDLVLVPSFDEAAPMVFGEAAAFGVPVLTTETVSAKELVEDKKIGFVCENSDLGLENALENLLKDKEKVYKSRYLPKGDNIAAVKGFEDIVSGRQQ